MLSDGALYTDAVRFVGAHRPPDSAQLNGLLGFSQEFEILDRFVKHQLERDWGTGGKGHYKDFYEALKTYLAKTRKQAETEFVDPGLSRDQSRKAVDFYAGILAHEFIQHLVAEALMHLALQPGHARSAG